MGSDRHEGSNGKRHKKDNVLTCCVLFPKGAQSHAALAQQLCITSSSHDSSVQLIFNVKCFGFEVNCFSLPATAITLAAMAVAMGAANDVPFVTK